LDIFGLICLISECKKYCVDPGTAVKKTIIIATRNIVFIKEKAIIIVIRTKKVLFVEF